MMNPMYRKLFFCLGIAILVTYAYVYFRVPALNTEKDGQESSEQLQRERDKRNVEIGVEALGRVRERHEQNRDHEEEQDR